MQPPSVYNSLRSSIQDNYLILLIVILGIILRIYDLGGENLWLDEFFSANKAKLGMAEMFHELLMENESNPPLHFIMLHYWVVLFGDSEFALRLPSALLGTFSIFIIYLLGKLLFNRSTGLIAALILAVSVFQIKFSQEARAYGLMMFLGLLSLYFFFRLLDSRSLKYSAGYIISSVLLAHTHYYGVLVIAAQNFYFFTVLLLKRPSKELTLKRWVFAQFILLVMFLPEFLYVKKASALQEGFWLTAPDLNTVLETFSNYSGSLPLLVLLSLFSILALVNMGDAFREKGFTSGILRTGPFDAASLKKQNALFFLVLIFFVIVVPFFISRIFTPVYYTRYTIVASAAFYLLAALGIDALNNKWGRIFVIVLIIAFSGYNLYGYYCKDQKPRWKDAISYVDKNAAQGEVLAIYPFFETGNTEYYSKRNDLNVMHLVELSELNHQSGGGNLWLIITERAFPDFHNYMDKLTRSFRILSVQEYTQLRLYRLKRKSG